MNVTCTRILEFDAGHRVVGHESKCKHLHGHRYKVEVTCTFRDGSVDNLGRTIDFSDVKFMLGGFLDEHLDHGLILWKDDPLLAILSRLDVAAESSDTVVSQKVYVMEANPTAENLAHHLLRTFADMIPLQVEVDRVRVWETPNCYADACSFRSSEDPRHL